MSTSNPDKELREGGLCAVVIVKWRDANETVYGPFKSEADAMDWVAENVTDVLFSIRTVFAEAKYTE